MKHDEKVWVKCEYCKGEEATYEEDPKHKGSFFQYLCKECDGTGGKYEHVRDS